MSEINLSQLPPPDVIEALDFERINDAHRADLAARLPEATAVLQLESEPLVKQVEAFSYRELLLRGRINEAARACLLAYSSGTDLEHLAALYGVTRLVTDPGDPDRPTQYETDDSLRARTQMAPEGFSTAGPVGAYRFHALSASGQVKDAAVDSPRFTSIELSPEQLALLPPGTICLACIYDAGLPEPQPGMVRVSVLGNAGDGTPAPELLATVAAALNAEDVRPLTDQVVVTAPEIIPYTLRATLTTYPGPAPAPVRAAAIAEALRYTQATHRLGYDVTLSGLYAALHRPGVMQVILHEPAATIVCGKHQAAYCTAIEIELGEIDA